MKKIRALLIQEQKLNNDFPTAPPPSGAAEAPDATIAAAASAAAAAASASHATAVTALILLLALFFLCFFSVYARSLFAGLNRSSSRRRRHAAASNHTPRRRFSAAQKGGLDQSVVSSLPILYYVGCGDDADESCVVCLAEFEYKEQVKVIPGCGHVFHPECIDEWLLSRGSCPVCRRTDIFGDTPGLSEPRLGVQMRLAAAAEAEAEIEEGERKEVLALEKSSSCSWSPGEEVKIEVFLRRSCSL